MSPLPGLFNYWLVVFLMMAGLFAVMSRANLVKKVMGLSIFQASVFVFYITSGKLFGDTAPIIDERFSTYANPLPQVLILTAIVVGVATTAVALALIVRIKEAYGTIEEDEMVSKDQSE